MLLKFIRMSNIVIHLFIFLILIFSNINMANIIYIDSNDYINPELYPQPLFTSGNGSINNPYQISNISQFQLIQENTQAHYILINDIEASETKYWNNGKGFEPIAIDNSIFPGHQGKKFRGSLNGKGYTITNLYINRSNTDYVGLFGYVDINSYISNIYLTNISINGLNIVGGVAGFNEGTIINCNIKCNTVGKRYIGGLIGYNKGNISDSISVGNISGISEIGGLIGYDEGYINNSYYCINRTFINNITMVTPFGIYENQYNDWVKNNKTININNYLHRIPNTDFYAINNKYDLIHILPFSAVNTYKFMQKNNINLIHNEGFYIPIFKGKYNGNNLSIYHLNLSSKINSFQGMFGKIYRGNINNLSIQIDCLEGRNKIGGLVGYNYLGFINNCYTTGKIYSEDSIDVGGIIGYNKGYVINCSSSCNIIAKHALGGVVGKNYQSVLINCTSNGTIRGINGTAVGGLIGFNNASIVKNSYATGYVSGDADVGGLIGYINDQSVIENSFSMGNVRGKYYLGGLIGSTDIDTKNSYVNNCYSTGEVRGKDIVGGFIGYNNGIVNYCYSVGNVYGDGIEVGGLIGRSNKDDNVLHSFWNIESSNQTNSEGGIGKNTTQMRNKSMFMVSDWDMDNIWNIIDSFTYPFLKSIIYIYPTKIVTENKKSINEDNLYSTKYSADVSKSNIPGIHIKWEAQTSANWLSFDKNGILQGIPNNWDVGSYFVNISFQLGYGNIIDFTNFTITVINVNDPPMITNHPYYIAKEDENFLLQVEAIDDDLEISVGEKLYYYLEIGPDGMTISDNGTIMWTPSNEQAHQSFPIIVKVSDNIGEYDIKEIIVNVSNVNDVPKITSSPILSVLEDTLYQYKVEVLDVDLYNPSGEEISFVLYSSPKDMNITNTGLITWIPNNNDVGNRNYVVVYVTDKANTFDIQRFEIDVINTNDPPLIVSSPKLNATEGMLYVYHVNASDDDLLNPSNETLVFILNDHPEGMTINPNTGIIHWTPQIKHGGGEYNVSIKVIDKSGAFHIQKYKIFVKNINNPPELIQSELYLTGIEDENITLYLLDVFIDPDGDILTFEFEEKQNISIILNEGFCLFIPDSHWSGEEIFYIIASDKEYEVKIQTHVTISPINDPPFIIEILKNSSYKENRDQIVSAIASDPDINYGDYLIYRWYSNNGTMLCEGKSVDLSLSAGHYFIKLVVIDSTGLSAEQSFEVTILPNENVNNTSNGGLSWVYILSIFIIILIIGFLLLIKKRTMKEE